VGFDMPLLRSFLVIWGIFYKDVAGRISIFRGVTVG
jgi:hypothetical protein